MRVADLITASLLMLVGGVVLGDAVRLGIGWGTDGPKSGFFPFWLALLLIGTCLGIIVQALLGASSKPFVSRDKLGPVLKVLVPALVLVLLMQWLGFYVSAALYIAVYMRWIGRHAWPAVLACALGTVVVAFLIFEKWFLVPMPKGPLEAWLGY
jgi:putative tricarboxylic transport membrane protein